MVRTNLSPRGPSIRSSTGSLTSMARRLSYASVLSGTTTTQNPVYTPNSSSDTFSHLMNPPQSSGPPPPDFSSHASSYPPRLSDSDHTHGIGQSLPDSWDRGPLPPYYSPFGSADDGQVQWRYNPRTSDFFVPTYLKGSRHMERLVERNRNRLAAKKEVKSHRSSNAGSLSTTPSSVNLHKLFPSHRGMTHDIIERVASGPEDQLNALPSRWSTTDKFVGLEVSANGTEVKFTGSSTTHDHGAAIRSDHPIPKECGIYYFEVTMLSKGKENLVVVSVSGPKAALNRIPGWEPESWAYHGDDGSAQGQSSTPNKSYGPKFGTSDVIGCGMNFMTGTCFFTKNGNNLGTAFHDVKAATLYPTVGLKKPGEHIRVNFGKEPFVFDIDKMVEREKAAIQAEIQQQDITRLSIQPESEILQKLVIQYLIHEGFMETAKAFREETHTNASLLKGRHSKFDHTEDSDAINRQRIRVAILEGDVDKALGLTTKYYPDVLEENEGIYFKLRCRKFIEMIRRCIDLQPSGKSGKVASTNENAIEDDDVFNGRMELDHQANGHEDFDGMDIEEPNSSLREEIMMKDALAYGQELRSEFKDDPRKEIKQALEKTFALIAYTDARESSLAPLLEADGRIPVAEELNSAILVSLGKSSTSALERVYQHSEVMISDLTQDGGAAALINVRDEYFRC